MVVEYVRDTGLLVPVLVLCSTRVICTARFALAGIR